MDKPGQNPAQILVAGPAWVGDMVMAQSLLKTLKQRNYPVEIDVLAPAWSNPILARMPEVRDAINMPVGHGKLAIKTRYQLGKSLRGKHYDQAIVTPRSYKSALVPFFAKAKRRTGYRGEMRYGVLNDIRPLDKNILKQTVQRYVALGLEYQDSINMTSAPVIPYPSLTIDHQNQQRLINKLGLKTDRPLIAFMPGAEYGEAKRWPLEYYRQLGSMLVDTGHTVWILGSEKDRSAADSIVFSDSVINLCGKTSLEDSIDLLSLCKTAVTNDSGLMHIAAAVDIPVVAIYGSSTPAYTPPLTNKAKIVYLDLECSPCFKRECPLGHSKCLRDIKAENVFKLVNI